MIYGNDGEVRAVFRPGSEGHSDFYRGLEILARMYRKFYEEAQNHEHERQEKLNQVLDMPDKKIIRRVERRKLKLYNLTQVAMILKVSRQTLYYWLKKGWLTPKRDHRNYPVFTVFDIERVMKWRHIEPLA